MEFLIVTVILLLIAGLIFMVYRNNKAEVKAEVKTVADDIATAEATVKTIATTVEEDAKAITSVEKM